MTKPPSLELLKEIDNYRHLITPGMTAGEFAALLPEHLQQPYWWSRIDAYYASLPEYDQDDE